MLKRLLNRLRQGPVVYGSDFFTSLWFNEWHTLKDVLARMIESEPKWQNVLDFGCGPGVMIDLMAKRGMEYYGCDYSVEARELYLQHYGQFPNRYLSNLAEALERDYDVLLALDVFEHMTDDEIGSLLRQVRQIPELLLNISRTKRIPGHINLKSDSEWIEFMSAKGYVFEEKRTKALRNVYAENRPGSPDKWDRNLFLFERAIL